MPKPYEMLLDHASAIETNLYSTGAQARLSAMPLYNSIWGSTVVLITGIEVDPEARGLNHGTAMLRHAIKTADARGVTLVLVPQSDRSRGGLDDAALTAWYTRYGFQLINPESPEMKRVPSTDIISRTETNTEKEKLPMKNPSDNTVAATATPARTGAFNAEAEQSLVDYVLVQIDDGADAEEITQVIIEQMSIIEDIEEAIIEFGTEDHDQLAREIVKHLAHKFQR